MKILVTGGFGYLGGRLAQFLADRRSHEVFLGTRRECASPAWLPRAKTVRILWDSRDAIEEVCRGMDAVIHLAGMNAGDCMKDPVEALNVNGVATARLLRSAASKKVGRFIYFSTAHVYAAPLTGRISEGDCPGNLHPYATTHRAGEDAVLAAGRRGDIEGVVVRLSNAFGAPAHKEADCWMLLVNDCCRQAVTTRQIVLRSTGVQRRDFITLADTVRASDHLLGCTPEALGDGLFNVGGGCSLRILDMVKRIAERCHAVLGFKPAILLSEGGAGDAEQPLDYCIDKLLGTGFELEGRIDDEIDVTLRFCAANFGEAE